MELEVTAFSDSRFYKRAHFYTSFNTLELPLQPEYKIADPICTYVFSILVVLTTVRILCDTGVIIMEGKIRAQSAVLYIPNTSECWRFFDVITISNKVDCVWRPVCPAAALGCWFSMARLSCSGL